MIEFGIGFYICNLILVIMIGLMLIMRHLLRHILSARMQYHLWFLFLLLLAVPFLPLNLPEFVQTISYYANRGTDAQLTTTTNTVTYASHSFSNHFLYDFTTSVSSTTPSILEYFLVSVWIIGILVMLLLAIRSRRHFHRIKRASLPLQNQKVQQLYLDCVQEMHLKRSIPIYSTAYLKSPAMVGFFRPCIYLPIHMISECNATDIRYMLLHELQHYKHKDALANSCMNLAEIVYWFNPLIWYALKQMRTDREIACDTCVLKMLDVKEYVTYGNTLINFVEKISFMPFPFSTGIGGSMRQIRKRIVNIASYQIPGMRKNFMSGTAFVLISLLLLSFLPLLSIQAAENSTYQWDTSGQNIVTLDLDTYFTGYQGSFVLYDLENDTWNIYNLKNAVKQTSPNSTYKIYDALFALDSDIISTEQSQLQWDQTLYSIDSWNANQDLTSAMYYSVNWYFQSLDAQLGNDKLNQYLHKIHYGNQDLSGGLSSYWMESTLKISAVEQVKLLKNLYTNEYGFDQNQVDAVIDSICITSSDNYALYGKTGTGRIDNQDVNGWFIGFVKRGEHTYFFATNIQADDNATGMNASQLTLSVLSDLYLF